MQAYMGRCLGVKNVREVPESEAIISYRAFNFGPKNLNLYGLCFGTRSPLSMDGSKARCGITNGWYTGFPVHKRSEAPEHNCTCGFYGLNTEKRARLAGSVYGDNFYNGHVIAEVEQWGKIVPHANGQRSEYIRVRRIVDVVRPTGSTVRYNADDLLAGLRAKYDRV